ncbi:26S proteasome regulatory subunit N10, partial [Tremellales sp. Uapishka_1]
MGLESCMLVLDNSEYMRNGDYTPTRFQAQAQAVSTVFTAKTDSNPESAVGLMTMAGKACVSIGLGYPVVFTFERSPSLLVTPTNDIGKLLSSLSKSSIGGTADLQTAVQIAQLALKHRENKNQRQRIVVFVGSPLDDSQDSLVKLGKRLRKNNVLVDVVTFGEEGMGNDDKLNALVEAAGGGESHLISVPPGPHLLADIIASSPILFDPDMPGAQAGGSGDGGMGDDLDPNMDPELAM